VCAALTEHLRPHAELLTAGLLLACDVDSVKDDASGHALLDLAEAAVAGMNARLEADAKNKAAFNAADSILAFVIGRLLKPAVNEGWLMSAPSRVRLLGTIAKWPLDRDRPPAVSALALPLRGRDPDPRVGPRGVLVQHWLQLHERCFADQSGCCSTNQNQIFVKGLRTILDAMVAIDDASCLDGSHA
jgi:hypothetical protein